MFRFVEYSSTCFSRSDYNSGHGLRMVRHEQMHFNAGDDYFSSLLSETRADLELIHVAL